MTTEPQIPSAGYNIQTIFTKVGITIINKRRWDRLDNGKSFVRRYLYIRSISGFKILHYAVIRVKAEVAVVEYMFNIFLWYCFVSEIFEHY